MRRPTFGQLYEAFKNANRSLPDKLKLRQSTASKGRKRKRKATESATVPTPVNLSYEEKGKTFV